MKLNRSEIVTFWGSQSPYSNWNLGTFVCNDVEFNCAEQLMLYRKAQLFGDAKVAAAIMRETDPREQKALGRTVKGFIEEIWDVASEPMMFEGLLAKFSQLPVPRNTLLGSGTRLIIEASPVDRVWGAGLAAADPRILDTETWNGANRLGNVLMRVRLAINAVRISMGQATLI